MNEKTLLKWEEKYNSNEKKGYLGKWLCFCINCELYSSKKENEDYELRCFLPGLKIYAGSYKKEQIAKTQAEFLILYWLEEAQLNQYCNALQNRA